MPTEDQVFVPGSHECLVSGEDVELNFTQMREQFFRHLLSVDLSVFVLLLLVTCLSIPLLFILL